MPESLPHKLLKRTGSHMAHADPRRHEQTVAFRNQLGMDIRLPKPARTHVRATIQRPSFVGGIVGGNIVNVIGSKGFHIFGIAAEVDGPIYETCRRIVLNRSSDANRVALTM